VDLPDKSDKQGQPAPPKKEIKQVVPTPVQVKRPASRRFFDFLFAESPKDLAKRVGTDVVVPRLKTGVEDALTSFIHGMFWGKGTSPLSGIVQGTVLRGGGYNYAAISSGPSALTQAREANVSRPMGNYQDLICGTQEHAEILLANLYSTLNMYNVVAVADLYEMAGMSPQPSDNGFGWMNLDGAKIVKDREGFKLELPRPNLIG